MTCFLIKAAEDDERLLLADGVAEAAAAEWLLLEVEELTFLKLEDKGRMMPLLARLLLPPPWPGVGDLGLVEELKRLLSRSVGSK